MGLGVTEDFIIRSEQLQRLKQHDEQNEVLRMYDEECAQGGEEACRILGRRPQDTLVSGPRLTTRRPYPVNRKAVSFADSLLANVPEDQIRTASVWKAATNRATEAAPGYAPALWPLTKKDRAYAPISPGLYNSTPTEMDLVGAGQYIDPNTGALYQTYERALPPPNKREGPPLEHTLKQTNRQLIFLQGGFDQNTPTIVKKERPRDLPGIADGPSFAGQQLLNANFRNDSRGRLARTIWQNRNGERPCGIEPLRDQYPNGVIGYQQVYRPPQYLGVTYRGMEEDGYVPGQSGRTEHPGSGATRGANNRIDNTVLDDYVPMGNANAAGSLWANQPLVSRNPGFGGPEKLPTLRGLVPDGHRAYGDKEFNGRQVRGEFSAPNQTQRGLLGDGHRANPQNPGGERPMSAPAPYNPTQGGTYGEQSKRNANGQGSMIPNQDLVRSGISTITTSRASLYPSSAGNVHFGAPNKQFYVGSATQPQAFERVGRPLDVPAASIRAHAQRHIVNPRTPQDSDQLLKCSQFGGVRSSPYIPAGYASSDRASAISTGFDDHQFSNRRTNPGPVGQRPLVISPTAICVL